jgi:TetR/AcrR family tetracycline transcriptional repressor
MAEAQVNRTLIVQAALAILAEDGLDAVSFRNVARALGIKAPSLYWHVRNKRELLGHMAEQLFRDILDDVPPASRWQAWLRGLALTVYRHQQQTRDIRRLMIEARMDQAVIGEFSTIMSGGLVERGLSPSIAFDAQRSAMTLATGWTVISLDPTYPEGTPEPSFVRSLDALIAGWQSIADFETTA